jgi:hypothetical protein
MGVRGCAQILSQGRKSAKSQLKSGKKLKKKSWAIKHYHGPIFKNLIQNSKILLSVSPHTLEILI